MDDIFYFSRHNVDLEDIRLLALENNLTTTTHDGHYMNVFVEGEFTARVLPKGPMPAASKILQEYWAWTDFHYVKGVSFGLLPENQLIVDDYGTATALMVSFHLTTLDQLTSFLQELLQKHGGWVGLDLYWEDDDGNPTNVFTVGTISALANEYVSLCAAAQ